MRRAAVWFTFSLGALVGAVALLVVFLLQAAPGQRFVLRAALNVVEGQIDGTLQVGAIRSAGLLRGFTLHRVALSDRSGRPFLEADSIRVGYAIRGFVSRDAMIEPLELFRPRVTIETLPGDTVPNVARIFAPEPRLEVEPSPPDFRLRFRRVRIEDGSLAVRAEDAETRIEGIQARILELSVLDPDAPGERARVQELSLDAHLDGIGEGPLVIRNLRGDVRRQGSRLEVEADELALERSGARGRLALDWSGALELELDLEADPFDARDLAWLDARIPEATGRFTARARGPVAEGQWVLEGIELSVDGGRHRASGRAGFQLGETLRLVDTDIDAELRLSLLEPWLEEPLPVEGRVRTRTRLSGPLDALQVNGELRFDDPERGIPESRATVAGRINPRDATVAGLSLRVDPLRLETLQALDLDWTGGGSLVVEASGGLERGLEIDGTLVHATAALDVSRIRASGQVQQVEGTFRLALDTAFDPVSLSGVERGFGVDLPVTGALSGEMRLDGLLTDLSASGAVSTEGGDVQVAARLDVTDPERGYFLEGATESLDLSAFVRAAPDPSTVAGSFTVEGAGFDPATLAANARVELSDGRWGDLAMQELRAEADARDGRLSLASLRIRSDLGSLEGEGDLALSAEAPEGEIRVRWALEDLAALRPILVGDSPAADTLSALELQLLQFEGIDPGNDEAVPLGGSAGGDLLLSGRLDALTARLSARGDTLAWRELAVERFVLEARADVSRGDEGWGLGELSGALDLEDPEWGRYAFRGVRLEVEGEADEAGVRLELDRDEGESYLTAGLVSRDGPRVTYDVDALTFVLDPVEWTLARPARIAWEEGRFEVSDLEVARPGNGEAVRMWLDGALDFDGALDLRAQAEGVDLERLAGILQVEPVPVGLLDLDLRVTGTAAAPLIDGSLGLRELEVADTRIARVDGTLQYADEVAAIGLQVEQNGGRLLAVSGSWPVNLALTEVDERFPSREVDLLVEIEDLPAATVLAPLEALEEVSGRLDGRIEFRGAPDDLRPNGSLRLQGGGFALPEVGLTLQALESTFTLNPDGRVEVEASARSVGSVEVTGSIDLSNLLDPGFDLAVEARGFQAVSRRDLDGRVSGTMFLRGRYTEPRVTGSIRVDQANLFLEEFARTAEVVDLTDPAFLAAVDTTLAQARRVAEAAQNPFLENLRVDADLSIPRDVWLRSRELNVEIGGDLIVTFDRSGREILLVGSVAAIRGNYNAFGRQFQVRSGTVDFVGTPGINPALSIEAVHRLRQQGGEPLDIVASLEGTLLQPRISLSSDSGVNISESDLISYLIFGRPSYALASAESRMLGDAAISAGIGAATGQLSALLGQQIGLDFFSITQAQQTGGFGALTGEVLVDTQVELGQYVTDNVFLALVLRPLRGIGGSQAQIPGARLEWRFTDLWTFNAYIEDRFGREGVYTFGELGLQVNRILGLELFREWGY